MRAVIVVATSTRFHNVRMPHATRCGSRLGNMRVRGLARSGQLPPQLDVVQVALRESLLQRGLPCAQRRRLLRTPASGLLPWAAATDQ